MISALAWRPLADVNPGPTLWARLGLAEHLARDRRGVALAKREEPQQVGDGIAFRPPEIGVRRRPGRSRRSSRIAAMALGIAGLRVGQDL